MSKPFVEIFSPTEVMYYLISLWEIRYGIGFTIIVIGGLIFWVV